MSKPSKVDNGLSRSICRPYLLGRESAPASIPGERKRMRFALARPGRERGRTLPDFVAFEAMFLVSSAGLAMLGLDPFSIRTGILVMIDLSVFWEVFCGIGVKSRDGRHSQSLQGRAWPGRLSTYRR